MKTAVVAALASLGAAAAAPKPANEPFHGRYRISPVDGTKIALPTKEQLAFQDREIGFLIHFNIATYIQEDGCNSNQSLVPERKLFDPELLNTDQWMESAKDLGAKYATLVAKHNCGFTTWPSKVQFSDRDGNAMTYNYTVAQSPVSGKDVIRSFVDSTKKYGLGHGFYYSSVVNNYLNVYGSEARNEPLAPGQVGVTTETYNKVVIDQLTELWGQYGDLTEIWFDGGYSGAQKASIEKLLEEKQSKAVIFNGCDTKGVCLSDKPIRWIGNEMGNAGDDNWSTGVGEDAGDPGSPFFAPAECDTSLQTQDRWFWGVKQPLRSLKEMVGVYHSSVGRNCVLALDLAPDRNGLVPADAVARYKELGDFIRSCYDDEEPSKYVDSNIDGQYLMTFDKPTTIDRIVMMEDQTNGQLIRSYNVYAKIIDSDGINHSKDAPWTRVSGGKSIGHKRIDLFNAPVTVTDVMINSTYVDVPEFRSVSVHLCERF